MNAQHTPGPWEAGQYGNSFIVTAKGGMYDVAVVRNIGNEDNAANARLIAAAPDLLEALRQLRDAFIVTSVEMQADAMRAARAAIAKATGGNQ